MQITPPTTRHTPQHGRDAHLKQHQLHQRYYLDGKQIPGVSTILKNIGWSTDGLLNWQKNLLLRGQDPDAMLTEAATLGTVTHQYLENWVNQQPTDASHIKPAHRLFAEQAVYHFATWVQQQQFTFLAMEQQVISRQHRYGGTFDVLGVHEGQRVLADFKTSKAVYPSHLIQLAAYQMAYDEEHPETPIQKMCVIKVSSQAAEFVVHWLTDQEQQAARAAFLHCRALYELKKVLGG